jgi:hypothetical protein
MTRHGRRNIPGAINHIITRGLNRKDIFPEGCDPNDFRSRPEKNLSQNDRFQVQSSSVFKGYSLLQESFGRDRSLC